MRSFPVVALTACAGLFASGSLDVVQAECTTRDGIQKEREAQKYDDQLQQCVQDPYLLLSEECYQKVMEKYRNLPDCNDAKADSEQMFQAFADGRQMMKRAEESKDCSKDFEGSNCTEIMNQMIEEFNDAYPDQMQKLGASLPEMEPKTAKPKKSNDENREKNDKKDRNAGISSSSASAMALAAALAVAAFSALL